MNLVDFNLAVQALAAEGTRLKDLIRCAVIISTHVREAFDAEMGKKMWDICNGRRGLSCTDRDAFAHSLNVASNDQTTGE